ncbi:hypothetical protein U2F10_33515 [Leptothoe sp. EHU-05/26/07-4]
MSPSTRTAATESQARIMAGIAHRTEMNARAEARNRPRDAYERSLAFPAPTADDGITQKHPMISQAVAKALSAGRDVEYGGIPQPALLASAISTRNELPQFEVRHNRIFFVERPMDRRVRDVTRKKPGDLYTVIVTTANDNL